MKRSIFGKIFMFLFVLCSVFAVLSGCKNDADGSGSEGDKTPETPGSTDPSSEKTDSPEVAANRASMMRMLADMEGEWKSYGSSDSITIDRSGAITFHPGYSKIYAAKLISDVKDAIPDEMQLPLEKYCDDDDPPIKTSVNVKEFIDDVLTDAKRYYEFYPNETDVVLYSTSTSFKGYEGTEIPDRIFIMSLPKGSAEMYMGRIYLNPYMPLSDRGGNPIYDMVHINTGDSYDIQNCRYRRVETSGETGSGSGSSGSGSGDFTGSLSGTYKYTHSSSNDSSVTFDSSNVTISYTSSGNTQSNTYTWSTDGSTLTVTKTVGGYQNDYEFTLSGDGDGTVTLTEKDAGGVAAVFGITTSTSFDISK